MLKRDIVSTTLLSKFRTLLVNRNMNIGSKKLHLLYTGSLLQEGHYIISLLIRVIDQKF